MPAAAGDDSTRQQQDREEARQVRRARRLGLLLMIGSAIVSLLVLYGLWILFTHGG